MFVCKMFFVLLFNENEMFTAFKAITIEGGISFFKKWRLNKYQLKI